ncbi:MAG: hypothetical protein ACOH2T_11565 [Pseudomonas sp.]
MEIRLMEMTKMTNIGLKKASNMRRRKVIMLAKRLCLYCLLVSSLGYNGWTWLTTQNLPKLDKVFLKYPLPDDAFVYGVSTNGGGATVGFSYRYYLSKGLATDEEILSMLADEQPFLITKDPEVNVETRGAELDIRVTGRINQFHSQALIRQIGSDSYAVVNINLTSTSGKTGLH